MYATYNIMYEIRVNQHIKKAEKYAYFGKLAKKMAKNEQKYPLLASLRK